MGGAGRSSQGMTMTCGQISRALSASRMWEAELSSA
jgi:hypothetical protein